MNAVFRKGSGLQSGWRKPLSLCLLALLMTTLTACGGGSNAGDSQQQAGISRIEVTPDTVLLTEINDTRQLTATAYDNDGNVMDVDFSWQSSNPAVLAVDDSGLVTSLDTVGSAIISVSAQGVSGSATLLAVELMPNSVLVDDTEILGPPQLEVDTEVPTVGSRYTVEVSSNVAAEVGDLLLASETATIGGRVVQVVDSGTSKTVTLEMVPVDELFASLKIDEVFKFTIDDAQITDDVAEIYDVIRNPDGSLDFIPKPTVPAATLSGSDYHRASTLFGQAVGTSQLFDCSTTLPNIPLTLTAPPVTTGVTTDLDLIVRYDSSGDNLQKLAVKGKLEMEFKSTLSATVAFEGKIECLMPLLRIPVPFNGAIAAYFGAGIWLGPGFEVGGKLTLAQTALEVGGKVEFTTEAGLQRNPASGELEMIDVSDSSQIDTQGNFKLSVPNTNNLGAGIRFEPALKTFAFAELSVGLNSGLLGRIARSLDWRTFKATAGLVESYNLATVEGQVIDTAYSSDYKNSLNLTFGLSADAIRFFRFFNYVPPSIGLNFDFPLYTSPQLLTPMSATADTETFNLGDTVNFTVQLKPNTLDYYSFTSIEPYNIDEIIIYRKLNTAGSISTQEVARTSASTGQRNFELSWVADSDGEIADDFFVFVDTKVLDIPFTAVSYPLLDELELGTVIGVEWQILPDFPEFVVEGQMETFTITVLDQDSNPVEGAILGFSAVGGTVASSSGITDANGEFTTTAQLDTGETQLVIEITASRLVDGQIEMMVADSVTASAFENATVQVSMLNNEVHLYGEVDAGNAVDGDSSQNDLPFYNEPLINASLGAMSASCCSQPPGDSASADLTASLDLQNTLDDQTGFLQSTSIQFSSQASASASSMEGNLTDVGVSGSGTGSFTAVYALEVYQPTQMILVGSAAAECEFLSVVIYKGSFDANFQLVTSEDVFQSQALSLNESLVLVPGQYYLRTYVRMNASAGITGFNPVSYNDSDSANCTGQLTITYQ